MKPCPFCGAPAQKINWFLIRCTKCPAMMETYSSREEIEQKWNCRTEENIIPCKKEGEQNE